MNTKNILLWAGLLSAASASAFAIKKLSPLLEATRAASMPPDYAAVIESLQTEIAQLQNNSQKVLTPKKKDGGKTFFIATLTSLAMPILTLQIPGVLPIITQVCNAIINAG